MSTASDAKNLAEDLRTSIGITHIWGTALQDKIDVLASEGTDVTSLSSDLRAIKAARLSLLARIDLLRTALSALVPTLRPLRLVEDVGDLEFRTAIEGSVGSGGTGKPQWRFTNSFDPEGIYNFSNGLKVGWAKVTDTAPDLEEVVFGSTLPWILSPVSEFSVTADTEYEYEFWLEAPDGRRSDLDINVTGDDGQPVPIETRTGKILVRDQTVTPTGGYLTPPSTLRRAQGVYIGSAINDITSRLEGYYGQLGISAPGSFGWYHNYTSAGKGWALWKSTLTGWLEAMKPLIKSTVRNDPGIKLYFNIAPFPVEPMTSADPGWATLISKGFSTDPLSWAAAAAGAYNWYYEFAGKELVRIFGADSNKVVLCYSWEENGNWYPFRIVNSDYSRNTSLENNAREATRQFADSVNRQVHPSGFRAHIFRNVAGGGLSLGDGTRTSITNSWLAWKNSIPTDTSSVTGRKYLDGFTMDTYQNWDQKSATDTSIAIASLNVFADYVEATFPGLPYGIQETSTSWVFRTSATASTLNGSHTFPRTTIVLTNAGSFASSGYVNISGKIYKYTGKSTNTLTGVTGPAGGGAQTASSGTTVKQQLEQGPGDAGGNAWWEAITDWAELKRAAGHLVMLIAFDSDNSSTDQYGILEHKTYSPVLYHFFSSPSGFVGNGSGASKAKFISEFGGARSTVTT